MRIKITSYNTICNLGNDIDEVYLKAINGNSDCFILNENLINKKIRIGIINTQLDEIENKNYNTRCNKIILKCLKKLKIENLIEKYGKNNIAIVVATTNSGVEEYIHTNNSIHAGLSNPAFFIKDYYRLNNFCASVSTACSSGIKAFSIAYDLLKSDFTKAAIVVGVDTMCKVPLYGFDSLEILSSKPTVPFSVNRNGINISEGCAAFILEKNSDCGIEILSIAETTDYYHPTTPNPDANEAISAINLALNKAKLTPNDIDYINLHGTGTYANDLMEAKAINTIFSNNTPSSSTKPLTGHALGAAASVETALCCKLLELNSTIAYPHIFDDNYDSNIKKIRLVKKNEHLNPIKNILSTSFGFGGTNAVIILSKGKKCYE